MAQAIRATASIPVFFEPVYIDGSVLVDGGVYTNLNVHEAILRCREHGFADKDIIVDVIMCFDKVVEVP